MNSLKELEKKYEELGQEIERLKEKARTCDDHIFLLSAEEYQIYKDKIPWVNSLWWLRSPGYDGCAEVVDYDGYVDLGGRKISSNYYGVRPALRRLFEGDDIIVQYGMTWIKIDKNLYIAEVPIDFKHFDNKNNNYYTSDIRQFLLTWQNLRKDLR